MVLKVLLVTPFMTGAGGTETVITNLFDVYRHKGRSDVNLSMVNIGGTEHSEWLANVPVHIIRLATKRFWRTLEYALFLPFILYHILRRYPADVIISTNPMMWFLLSKLIRLTRRSTKVLAWYHYSLKSKPMKSKLLLSADYYWAISSGIKQQLIVAGVDPHNISLVYNPIKPTVGIMPRSTHGTNFIYIGRVMLDGQKNLRELLASLQGLTGQWHLDVFGDGVDLPRLKQLAIHNQVDQHITWHGFNKYPWQVIHAADALLLTSTYEGLPMVLNEAIARGVYVISSDADTGPDDIVQEKINGELYHLGDVNQLHNKLQQLINGKALPDQMKIKQSIAHMYEDNYYQVIEESLIEIGHGKE